jgi:hypothetical protein
MNDVILLVFLPQLLKETTSSCTVIGVKACTHLSQSLLKQNRALTLNNNFTTTDHKKTTLNTNLLSGKIKTSKRSLGATEKQVFRVFVGIE